MAKATSAVLPILFIVIFASLEIVTRGDTCVEGLGRCKRGNECDARCKAKRGASGQGTCDDSLGTPLCTCGYTCEPPPKRPSPPKPKPPKGPRTCNDGLGLCSGKCGADCCSQKCASKHHGGSGYCADLGFTSLCNCQYTC